MHADKTRSAGEGQLISRHDESIRRQATSMHVSCLHRSDPSLLPVTGRQSWYTNGRIAGHITARTSEVEEREPYACRRFRRRAHALFIHYSPVRKQCQSRAACRSYWPCSHNGPIRAWLISQPTTWQQRMA